MAVIAVCSSLFSPAEEIIGQVAQRLGSTVVGEELIEQAAQAYGTSVDKLTRAMTGSRGFFNPLTRDWEKSIIYLKAALARVLATDDQIYHGPALHLIPKAITHVLRVGILADPDYRLERAQRAQGIGAKEAGSQIKKADQELAAWTQQLLSLGPWDSTLYDIKIPFPATSETEAVDIICEHVGREALKPTDDSIQAVLDFQLATKINVAVLERGHYNCDVQAEKGRVTVVVGQSAAPAGKLARTVRALRFENVEDEVREIAGAFDEVSAVEVRPGAGYTRPTRTLLVDDEREYVLTLSERLEMRDIPSDVVYDGNQALTFVNTEVPDVMVLDLRMPGIDGLEVLRKTKQDHPEVEVIIVTGHGSDKDERIARELGAFDYLKKPVDINVLAQKIQQASEKARQRGARPGDPGDDEEQ